MTMSSPIVVDTNILFSALVSQNSRIRETLLIEGGYFFFSTRFVFVELFKHKERLVAATRLPEDELLDALNAMLTRIHFIDEFTIPIGVWLEARRLCSGIDEKDTPFVALAIHLTAQLWTEDEVLKIGLHARGFDQFFKP
jgi:predicted nucleic acid-binding protein